MSFHADPKTLDREQYLIETYQFETSIDPEEAAEHLCQEKSTAQWSRVGVDEDFRPKHAAKILELKILEEKEQPFYSSPFTKAKRYHVCRVKLANPHINFGAKIPNLLTAVCGEGAFYSPGITAIKLMDLDFPLSYLNKFEGPKFGVEGFREVLQIFNRPIFLGVVKPNIGLAPEDFAKLAYESWLGGLDAPKDDEMLADADYSSLGDRMRLLGKLKKEAEQKTGEKKMFIANITDEVDRLQELHDLVVSHGINAAMINGWTTGLSAVRVLRKKSKIPLVAHFDFVATFSRIPFFGVSSVLAVKLQRLAGFDAIIFGGCHPRMQTTEEEMLASVDACLKPWGNIRPALPVPGGSDWAGTLPTLLAQLKTTDFGVVPGRGVFNHPAGPYGGGRSYRQAWEAIEKKIPLEEYAQSHVELRQAIEAFGK